MRSDSLNQNSSVFNTQPFAVGYIGANIDISDDADKVKNRVWFINATGVTSITIPDPGEFNAGDWIKFVITAAIAGDMTIKTETADSDMYGHLHGSGGAAYASNPDTANKDKIVYDVSACASGAGDLGDSLFLLSDGTNWYVEGQTNGDVAWVFGEQ
tara:strand:- start:55 stop:525 length:471 start_codon:yes stop_codon:yes gene_type:complete